MPGKGKSLKRKTRKGNSGMCSQAVRQGLSRQAPSDMPPQSMLTSASARSSSQRGSRSEHTSAPATSTSSEAAEELMDLLDEEDPLGELEDEDGKMTNITRSNIRQFVSFAKGILEHNVKYLGSSGFGTPLVMKVESNIPAPVIRRVASCINSQGIMTLPGNVEVDLYKLAPCVVGSPNKGDYVWPSLGIPKGARNVLNSVQNGNKKINLLQLIFKVLAEQPRKLIDEDVEEDREAGAVFRIQYMLVLLGLVHAPNSTVLPDLQFLGPLCTGQDYMWCDFFVDYLVDAVTSCKNGQMGMIKGDIGIPVTIAADLAILDGDNENSPVPGFPRYEKIDQKRLDRLYNANWEKLKFRTVSESIYSEIYHPRSCSDVLGAGSSHASSPQPRGLNRDEQPDNCQGANPTVLARKLYMADSTFIKSFLEFLMLVINKFDEDTKKNARSLIKKLCKQGKSVVDTEVISAEAISDAIRFISENKDSFRDFAVALKAYSSDIAKIDQERTPQPGCNCSFSYPHGGTYPWSAGLHCADLKCLAPNHELTDTMIELYILHLQGQHILPELRSSLIHGKYFIMDPLYYQNIKGSISTQNIQAIQNTASKLQLAEKDYLFFPVNVGRHHWSVAIICKGVDQNPTVLHLDSFDIHDTEEIFFVLRQYINKVLLFDGEVKSKKLEVPKQSPVDSALDCGLFMLYSIKKFIEDNGDWQQINERWYEPSSASALRSIIKELIHQNKMKRGGRTRCTNAELWATSLLD